MKVSIVSPRLKNGGTERVASILANNLYVRGHLVQFICIYERDAQYKIDEGIKLEFCEISSNISPFKILEATKFVCNRIRSFAPDVILSFVEREVIPLQLSGFKVVHTFRNDPINYATGLIDRFVRKIAYANAEAVIFQTEVVRSFFPPATQAKSIVLPNPIETERLPRWDCDSGSTTFVAAGRLEEQKNHSMLLKAFAGFHKNHPDFSLDIYGEGGSRNKLQEEIDALDLADCVRLPGNVDNIHEIMAKSFAYVLSSDYEGVSNSMLEALCIGVPCISTDYPSGGAREYIVDGFNGLLVEPKSVEGMTDALNRLSSDMEFCYELSLNTQSIIELVDSAKVCSQWENVLLRVVGEESR